MPETNIYQNQGKLTFTKKVWIAGSILFLFVIFFVLFKSLFSVLLLTLAGILFAIFFHGCAGILQKHLNMSQGWSLAIAIVFNILLLVIFFWFMGARLQQQISSLTDTLPKTINDARTSMQQTKIGRKALDYLNSSGNSQKMVLVIKKFFSSSFGILSDVYIILLFGIFFIAGPSIYIKGIVHLLPSYTKGKGEKLLGEIHDVLKNWIKGQLIGFLFITVLTGLGLWIIGMPLVLTLALIAGLLNFIPNFGPIIALIPAVLIALTQSTTMVIIVVCLFTFIQIMQSAVTQPLIQQKMVSIPPALIIFGQVAMGLLAGFWGVLLATPVIAIIITVVNKLYVEQQVHHKNEVRETN